MEVFGCEFGQFFGMTENTGSVTYLEPASHQMSRSHLLKSVGKPYPGMQVQIRSADGRVVQLGEHGEVCVRSPTALQGWWNRPEQTLKSLIDGWYPSVDGGYLDDEGFLYLTERIKDMIVSGGENIYPAEVEEVLRQHPSVADVAVIAIRDQKWGELVAAIVECRKEAVANVEERHTFARDRIAGFKCPKQIHSVTALPRTASVKVKKAELRDCFSPRRDEGTG